MKITEHASRNFSDRRDGKKPYLLILHYTDTKTTKDAVDILCDPAQQVSAHYVVGDDGEIFRLVDEDKRAWHAGRSFWAGEEDINSCSIGIEIQNTGHSHGLRSFPAVQLHALSALCRDIIKRHNIQPQNVLGHSDIAPGRKVDPGHLFPWRWLAEEGVGAWPDSAAEDDTGDLMSFLVSYGYDQRAGEKSLITEFQRHFEPAVFEIPGAPGVPTGDTVKIIKNLLRQKSLYS
jgi:N-acetylmuramoyl-L-alanine amidase